MCFFFPKLDLQWLIDEAKLNLPQELDFVREATNAGMLRPYACASSRHILKLLSAVH